MISLGAGDNFMYRRRRSMAALGADDTVDLSQYFSQFGLQNQSSFVPPGSPCYSAPWNPMLGSDGKCYLVCTVDPSKSFEIDSQYCRSGAAVTSGSLPSWAIPAGIGALLLILMMR